jgi:hypothetical protein
MSNEERKEYNKYTKLVKKSVQGAKDEGNKIRPE